MKGFEGSLAKAWVPGTRKPLGSAYGPMMVTNRHWCLPRDSIGARFGLRTVEFELPQGKLGELAVDGRSSVADKFG